MATEPGDDCQADNHGIESLIQKFLRGKISEADAVRLTITLQYRIAMALLAEAFLDYLHLAKLSSYNKFSARRSRLAIESTGLTALRAFELVAQSGIIPRPAPGGVTIRYGKPDQYVARAAASTPGLTEEEFNDRLQKLKQKLVMWGVLS